MSSGPRAPIVWLDQREVLAIHARQLAEHGGAGGSGDANLLDSALARPKNRLACGQPPPDVAELAAAYGYGIIANHPFVDGNKRVGFVATRLFLLLNGTDLTASADDRYLTFLAVAAGRLDEVALAAWIRRQLSR